MLKDKEDLEGESLAGMWASRESWGLGTVRGVGWTQVMKTLAGVLRADDGVNHNIGSYVPRL